VTAAEPSERPLREWPLEQLAEQAVLHATDVEALSILALEARHRRGPRAKALEAQLVRMIAACTTTADPQRNQAARLRTTLAAAAREITVLRARVAALEQAQGPQLDPEAGAAFRRVYLHPDVPAWLLTEVRRAFRRRYHPDTAADQQHRRRSEEVFKRAEADFEAIERLRRK
jgi:murein DD-endopeptidase MepM/ murein hydrolase activator NlpD